MLWPEYAEQLSNGWCRLTVQKSYNEFLDSYYLNLPKCFLESFRTVVSETILKKKATFQFS